MILLCLGAYAHAIDGWADPAGGWDLLVEFDDLLGKTLETANDAALDGTWNHDNGSDQWDGSAPGIAGAAPGGIAVEKVDSVVVLSIEDAGDPRSFTPPVPDPSNRKIYLTKDIGYDGDILADGVTFIARFRINPNPKEAPANGYTLHDGAKGHVAIGSLAVPKLFSLALDEGAILYFGAEDQAPITVSSEFEFQSVWATVVASGDQHEVNIYLNGSTDPAFSGVMTLGGGNDSIFANYLAIGMGSTGRDGAVQIDYIGCKAGVFPPELGAAVNPAGKLSTTWGELKK
jgi:hypothetical protein